MNIYYEKSDHQVIPPSNFLLDLGHLKNKSKIIKKVRIIGCTLYSRTLYLDCGWEKPTHLQEEVRCRRK